MDRFMAIRGRMIGRRALGRWALGQLRAPVLAEATDVIKHVDPDLTIWGLRLIYRRNSNQ